MDNQLKFDPETGKPIEETATPAAEPVQEATANTTPEAPATPTSQQIQQATANVGQSEEQFMNNTAQVSNEEEVIDKDKKGIKLIVLFFIIMILAIVFLFPMIQNLLG